MLHSLTSGSVNNSGYDALQWESILHGDAGVYGKYSVLQVLPDKIGRFLFEYHSELFNSLSLPDLPSDRSSVDVHRLLDPKQVCNHMAIIYAYFTYSAYSTYFTYLFIDCIYCIYCIFYIFYILSVLEEYDGPEMPGMFIKTQPKSSKSSKAQVLFTSFHSQFITISDIMCIFDIL